MQFHIEITLIGDAIRHLPYVIQAWRRAGTRGLGQKQAKFSLDQVDVLDFQAGSWRQLMPKADDAGTPPTWNGIPHSPSHPLLQASIELSTPYRGKLGGHLVTPDRFSAQGFVVALIKRIYSLQQLHDPSREPLDTETLVQAAAGLELKSSQLRWKEWTRHSSRQRTHMQMGGVTGVFTLAGEGLDLLWQVLQLGQWLHAGKSTLFGLGRYRVVAQEYQP
jgi:hypothetical protein